MGRPWVSNRLFPSGELLRHAPTLQAELRVAPPAPRTALLIQPFYPKDPHGSFGKHVLTPAQSLTAIAAATPPDWKVTHWDENLLQGHPPIDPFPSVVGITVHLTFARRAYELAAWYQARGALVVLGGLHVTSCPEEAAPHADALAVGEGVGIWPEILRDAQAGKLRPRYLGSNGSPFADEPVPRRGILDQRDFLTSASLIATRGCHNRCSFCCLSTRGSAVPYQTRPIEQVVEDFRATGEPYGVFIDNNLGSDPEYLRALCRALRPLGRIWCAATSLEVTDDPSLVLEMALAGCTGVFVGFESLSAGNLEESGKRTPPPEDYGRRVAMFHRHGIQVNGSFVLGFDHDRPDVFRRTVEWIEANRLECATFHILTPYPGTPLFRRYERDGRLLHRDWDRYDTAHCVFMPRHMTPQELEEGYAWCYRRLFSLRSIWRRRPARAAEVPGYLAMTLFYKKMNFFWPLLIRHRLTHAAWRPLVECARRRNIAWRRRLEATA